MRVSVDVADSHLLGPHQSGKRVAQVEAGSLVLQEDDDLRLFGVGHDDVDQTVSIDVASRQVAIFAI